MGLNEFAGYFAVAGSALATGFIAARYGLRPRAVLSRRRSSWRLGCFFRRCWCARRSITSRPSRSCTASCRPRRCRRQREVFWRTTLTRSKSVERQPGGPRQQPERRHGVGPVSALLRAARMTSSRSARSPRSTRRRGASRSSSRAPGPTASAASGSSPAACGSRPSASGRGPVVRLRRLRAGAALLGVGTAMVYPTLLAAIGDVAHPSWRASSVGVYRLWRDSATRSARCSLASRPMHSACRPRCGSSPRSRSSPASWWLCA